MIRKIFIVKPDSEFTAAHKLFTIVMKFPVMSKIEVIDKSTGSNCFTNLAFLFL